MADDRTDRVLDALGDPTRRRILERLRDGERNVGQIADGLPVSRPAVSQHLKVLREAGVVAERRDGTRRWYRVEADGLARVRAFLDGFWDTALANLKAVAESGEDPDERDDDSGRGRAPGGA